MTSELLDILCIDVIVSWIWSLSPIVLLVLTIWYIGTMIYRWRRDTDKTPPVTLKMKAEEPEAVAEDMKCLSEKDVQDILDIFNLAHLDAVYTHLDLEERDIENAKLEEPLRPKERARKLLNLLRNRRSEAATRGAMITAMMKYPDCRKAVDKLKIKWESCTEDSTLQDQASVDVDACRNQSMEEYRQTRGKRTLPPSMSEECTADNDNLYVDLEEEKTPKEDKIKRTLKGNSKQPISADFQREVLETDWIEMTGKDGLQDLKTCQKKLMEIYQARRGGIGFLPGLKKEFSSDEFFGDLQLLQEQKTPTKVRHIELDTYTDLLKIQDSKGKCLEHVIVSGLAGTGKSTLVSRLAYQWANREDDPQPSLVNTNLHSPNPLGRFQLVFALDIRKFKPDLDLIDTIHDQLLRHTSKQVLESYILAHADKCLFLFDGYDELGSNEIVLASDMLCGACVILTTRPNKVKQFYERHLESRYIQVELNGFSWKQVCLFVERFFGQLVYPQDIDSSDYNTNDTDADTSKARLLLNTIQYSSVLMPLSKFPLLLAMMCVIWEDQLTMPESITSLYHLLIEFLAKHLKTRFPIFDSTYTGCKPLLIKLGKTGFEGLMDKDSKLIFYEDEFESLDVVENGCKLGLLTKNSKISGFDTVTEVSFIHKTFQEFCSAVYLCNMSDGNPHQLKSCLSQMDIDNLENVLMFCCGESVNAAKEILSHVSDLACVSRQHMQEKGENFGLGHDTNDPFKLPLTLLYQCESNFGFTESLHSILKPLVTHITLSSRRYPPDYVNVLEHYMSESNPQHNWLRFVKTVTVNVSDRGNSRLCLSIVTHMPNLSTLNISACRESYEDNDCSFLIKAIQDQMVGKTLEMLDFENCVCDTVVIRSFLDTQPNLKTLSIPLSDRNTSSDIKVLEQILDDLAARSGSIKKLSVRGCDISRFLPNIGTSYHMLERLELIDTGMTLANVQDLIDSIKYIPHLKCVYLSNNHIGSDGATALAASFQHIPQLKCLDLSNNHIGSDGATALSASFQHIGLLEELSLSNNNIGSDGATALSASFQYIPLLERLDLPRNNIGSVGATALSASFQHIPQLLLLNLSNNNIGSDGATALSTSFPCIPFLKRLDLSKNNIGSDGASVLSASFKHMYSLRKLNLGCNPIGPAGVENIFRILHHLLPDLYLYLKLLSRSHNEQSDLLKACVEVLQKSHGCSDSNDKSEYSDSNDDSECSDSDDDSECSDINDDCWFDMKLMTDDIRSVINVVKRHTQSVPPQDTE